MTAWLPVFVYGTLLRGEARASLLGALPRRPARASGVLYRMPAGYPALQPVEGAWVHGELVAAPDETLLAMLDQYEGVPEGLYDRRILEVVSDEERVPAWAWVMDHPTRHGGRRITATRWRSGWR